MMKGYFFRTPFWMKWLYSDLVWSVSTKDKVLFLTFDDGPTPVVTEYVLQQLSAFHARATFFCIGNRIKKYPSLFERVLSAGHQVGNHTENHLNGWKTENELYLRGVRLFDENYSTAFFRPPYGKLTRKQKHSLSDRSIIMWSHMAGDFDRKLDVTKSVSCLKNAKPGSILVFHDSERAFKNLRVILPRVLKHFSRLGYQFKTLEEYAID